MVQNNLSKKVVNKCGGKRLSKKTKNSKVRSKKTKNSKGRSKVSRKKVVKSSKKASASMMERMKDPKLSALCMKCFSSSGRKIRSRVMKLNNRTKKVTAKGVGMIRGECSVCSGKMVVFVKN